jgi:hypothetical protein
MNLDCYIYFVIGIIIGWFSMFIGTPLNEVKHVWFKVGWLIFLLVDFGIIFLLTYWRYV